MLEKLSGQAGGYLERDVTKVMSTLGASACVKSSVCGPRAANLPKATLKKVQKPLGCNGRCQCQAASAVPLA
jgi:hypothetical protein